MERVTDLCARLRTLKNASKLRKMNLPCALLKSIKWGSTYAMLKRYLDLADKFRDCSFEADVLNCIPSAVDHAKVCELCLCLKDFNDVSMLPQLDGQARLDLDDIRVQFDGLISKYPVTAKYLDANAAIVQNKALRVE